MPAQGLGAYLFTDIEGSTSMWEDEPETMSAAVARHDAVLDLVVARHDGEVFTKAGDSFAVRFPDVEAAVAAAIDAQRAIELEVWGTSRPLAVRMGIHAGTAEHRGDDYFGAAVSAAARVMSAAHGGQILISDAALSFHPSLTTTPMGAYRLRGLAAPVLLHQIDASRSPRPFPPLRATRADGVRLPVFSTTLFGRESEVTQLTSLLREHALVTIVGPGGMGKTRLAVAAAEASLDVAPDGITFVDLVAVDAATQVAPAVIEALRLQTTGTDPLVELTEHLSGRETLLVLDNCEHVVDAVAALAGHLLAHSHPVRILATSRERLGVDGEQLVPAQPLPGGAGSASRALFLDRARAIDPGYATTEDDLQVIDALTEQLDGLPLAIELAACRTSVLSPADLLAHLDDRFRILSGGQHQRTTRERTLLATLDWSFRLLGPDEQRLLRLLSVFPTSFDAHAAAAVAAIDFTDALDLLESLHAKSLVASTRGATTMRFRLLETVRAYSAGLLGEDPAEVAAARRRHTDHFLTRATVSDSFSDIFDLDRAHALAADVDNLSAAIDDLTAREAWSDLCDLAWGALGVVFADGYGARASVWAERAAPHAGALGDEQGARLHYITAVLHMDRTRIPAMEAELRASLQLATDPVLRAKCLLMALTRQCSLPAALVDRRGLHTRFEEVRSLLAHASDHYTQAQLALFECYDHLQHDELDAVIERARTSMQIPTHHMLDLLLANVSAVAMIAMGKPERALTLLAEVGEPRSMWEYPDVVRSVALAELGELVAARQHLRAFAERAALGRIPLLANDAIIGLAILAHVEGDAARAERLVGAAVIGRSPHISFLAHRLATALGTADERIRALLGMSDDLGIPLADDLLRSELGAGALD